MKSLKQTSLVLVGSMFVFAAATPLLNGQSSDLQRTAPQNSPYSSGSSGSSSSISAGGVPSGENPFAVSQTPTYAISSVDGNWSNANNSKALLHKAADELRDAKSAEDKAKAVQKLRDLLSNYFNADMQRREAELKKMDERLQKLRQQMTQRREKMDQIIDLQMKVLSNEAEGLGFFSSGSNSDLQLNRNTWYFDYVPNANPPRTIAMPQGQPPISPPARVEPADPLFAPGSQPQPTNAPTPAPTPSAAPAGTSSDTFDAVRPNPAITAP